MKRILPDMMYLNQPCSAVAVGCALKLTSRDSLKCVLSDELHTDGYLSLRGANKLIRANLNVRKRVNYKRGERPTLREFCHDYSGKAIVCVLGHFVYVENGNYYSFFHNGSDEVVSVWCLRGRDGISKTE